MLPGGFLDLQYVRLIRGSVRSYLDGNYAVAIGASAGPDWGDRSAQICAGTLLTRPARLTTATHHTTGGGALLYPGAGGNFLGVVFLNPMETWLARDIKGAFIIGGNVLNLGGLVTFTGCHFFNMGPTAVRYVLTCDGDV